MICWHLKCVHLHFLKMYKARKYICTFHFKSAFEKGKTKLAKSSFEEVMGLKFD